YLVTVPTAFGLQALPRKGIGRAQAPDGVVGNQGGELLVLLGERGRMEMCASGEHGDGVAVTPRIPVRFGTGARGRLDRRAVAGSSRPTERLLEVVTGFVHLPVGIVAFATFESAQRRLCTIGRCLIHQGQQRTRVDGEPSNRDS